mmetsp:Transcript_9064/g.27632  ORF Transcript_9064/g.27632 Transcript_9064/m.27632 type:complete len:99 (+) Transcript_9064:162-458(+)
MGFLTFVSLSSSKPTDALLALLDNQYFSGQEAAIWLALILYSLHALEVFIAAAVLLTPPLRAPVSTVFAWAPLIMAIGFPITLKVWQLRWAELKAKAR